jgi:phage recombination protein Bet
MSTTTANGAKAEVVTVAREDRVAEFVPFMEREAIKLSVKIVTDMICVPTKKGHRCDEITAMKFIAMCKARLLNPFAGDAYLLGYDSDKHGPQFSLITAHQAFLKRAETHAEYDGMDSGVIVARPDGELVDRVGDFTLIDDEIAGAWATVFFKNRTHPTKKRIRFSVFDTGQSRWEKDPAGMIVKVAEADALRSSFPSMLGGMYLAGEIPDGGFVSHDKVSQQQLEPPRARTSDAAERARGTSTPVGITHEPEPPQTDYESFSDPLKDLLAAIGDSDTIEAVADWRKAVKKLSLDERPIASEACDTREAEIRATPKD